MSATPRTSPASTPPPSAERRGYARRQVLQDQIVPIAFDGDNGGLILDVSQYGCAVQAVGSLESGHTTQFDFVLPDSGKRLRGRGEVRWSEKSGRAGLRFLEFSRGSLADLTTWLARPFQAGQEIIPSAAPAEAPRQEPAQAIVLGAEALAATAQRVREQTHASGVAIAIGPPEDMVCRASVGAAPAFGAKLQADSGLSGECVRTGVLVRCDDTETDLRVDAEVCRLLDLRSAVLVPIVNGKQMAGVLEVFSNVPRAFGSQDIQRLNDTAEQIRAMMFPQEQRQAAAVSAATVATQPAQTVPSAPIVAAEPLALPAMPAVTPARETPGPVPPPSPLKTAAAPAKTQAAPSIRPASPILPGRTSSHPRKLTRAERSAEIAARQAEQFSAPTFGAEMPGVAIPRAAKIGFVSALAFAALIASLWAGMRSRPVTKPKVPAVTANATTSAVKPAAEPSIQPPAPAVQPKPEVKGKATEPAVPKPTIPDDVTAVAPEDIRRPQAIETAPTPPPLAEAAIPNLPVARPVAPSPALRTSGLVPGKLIHRVAPEYPAAAYAAHISGDVVLNAVIRNDGSIGAVEVVSGNPVLARAAVAAVRLWRYEPYMLDGSAVEATANIRLTFKAPRAYGLR